MTLAPAVLADLAPTGVLRAGINFGNPVIVQRDPGGGDPHGVGPSLARELARRLGVPMQISGYETAGRMADAATEDAWDIAFLAIDPARAETIAFTDAYVHIEGIYLVPTASALRVQSDFDREGVRIAVGAKTAYDLYLSRKLKHAQLIRADSSIASIEQFLSERLEAAAGVRQPLVAAARARAGLRVIDESFMVIRQAAGVPKGRAEGARYLAEFIEDVKRSGFVAHALRNSGIDDVTVAPPAPR